MKLHDINYASLQEMENAWLKAVRLKFKSSPLELVLTILLCLMVMAWLFAGAYQAAVIMAFAIIGFLGKGVIEYKNSVWKRFAQANGWAITPGRVASVTFVPPSLLNTGHSRQLGDIVHADIDGHLCSIYMYQFATGSGKSRRTHYYTIVRTELAKPFPHLILDSKKSWAIKERGTATAHTKLEGNFNEYFSLYFAKGKQIDALSIITPDVMQTLIDSNYAQDIEIIDTHMYFMIHSDKRNVESLPPLLVSVDALSDEIAHKAKTLQYQTADIPNIGHLEQSAAQYFKSADRVMNTLIGVVILIILLPLLIFIVIGAVSALSGN
jgi:hypothetical protein